MKVLLAHDFYRSSAPSGEDAVFRNERELLETNGIQVVSFERFNDDIDDTAFTKRLRLGFEGAWSKRSYQELCDVIRRTRPVLAHFHNTFPLISPSAYAACQDNGVPVVQTLHNYRLICPGGLLLRNGRPCEDCVGTDLGPALRHRCYRGSLPATGAVVWMLARNRWQRTYGNLVNRYIALTQFAAGRLMAGGLPERRMEVKPNFLPNPPQMGWGGGNYAIFVGRLSEEKGLRSLIDAWRHVANFPLKIVGDGPLRLELEERARQHGLHVEFLGFQSREDVLRMVGRAEVQIIPSECYEGFPMVVLEAYACGTPIVASRIGSLDEIVVEGQTGMKFEPGSPEDLAKKVNLIRSDDRRLHAMRINARARFEDNFTADRNFPRLAEIYRRARADFEESTSHTR